MAEQAVATRPNAFQYTTAFAIRRSDTTAERREEWAANVKAALNPQFDMKKPPTPLKEKVAEEGFEPPTRGL